MAAPRAYEILLATIRERCPEAETALAAHLRDTLTLLLPQFQGRTVTESGVDDSLDTLLEGLVARQLANSESWGEAEDARRLSVVAPALSAHRRSFGSPPSRAPALLCNRPIASTATDY